MRIQCIAPWEGGAAAHIALAFQYAECAARHHAVVEAWIGSGEFPPTSQK